MRKTCLDCIHDLARTDPRIFFVGSDLGAGTLGKFREEMPDRFFMEGISEQHVVGMAAGLALEGKIPYVNTIATFLTRRCLDQVALDLCLQKAKVRLVANGGGLVYAPLGPTHQALEDIALMRALPGMAVLVPADARELAALMPQTVDWPGPLYIRLAKGYDPVVTPEGHAPQIGRAWLERPGRDALVACTGTCLGQAREAADLLAREGRQVAVLHLPTVKPFDLEAFLDAAAPVPVVVSIEEHSVIGGLGSAVAEALAEACFPAAKRFKRLGIPDVFPHNYGSQNQLKDLYGISSANLAAALRELWNA
ncbi:MAG: transketolase C-terminal domain-containing protein [Thermodesulfobacteriota bacterium]